MDLNPDVEKPPPQIPSAVHDTHLDSLFLQDFHGSAQLCVRKSQVPGAGLGLVSMSRVEEGQDIFWKEQMCFVSDNHLSVTCDNCLQWMGRSINAAARMCEIGRSGLKVKSCTRCKVMRYCSRDCQRNAWKSHHKYECKFLADHELPHLPRALLRLLCRRANGSLSNLQWDAIQSLGSHLDKYRETKNEWEEIVSSSKKVKELLGLPDSEEDIQSWYCRILLNCMGLGLLEFETVGIALDPLVSLMNHSCDPNAVCLFEGTTVHVRSLKPISPGQEIFISYTDNTMDCDVRSCILQSKWFFICTCPKCLHKPSNGRLYNMQIKRQLLSIADSTYMLRKPKECEAAVSKICGSTTWEEVWPESMQPMPHLRFGLAHGYLANGNWIDALRHIVPVCLVSDPILFSSPSHPVHVGRLYMMLYIISRLTEEQEHDGPGAQTRVAGLELPMIYRYCLLKLMEDVTKSHGEDSMLGKAIQYMCAEQTTLLNETAKILGKEQQISLASWMTGPLQEMAQAALGHLLTWAGVRHPLD